MGGGDLNAGRRNVEHGGVGEAQHQLHVHVFHGEGGLGVNDGGCQVGAHQQPVVLQEILLLLQGAKAAVLCRHNTLGLKSPKLAVHQNIIQKLKKT